MTDCHDSTPHDAAPCDSTPYTRTDERLDVLGPMHFMRLPRGCAVAIVLITFVLVALVAIGFVDGMVPFAHVDALSAAGVFGRGANADLIARLRAVTNVLKDNLLGFIGGAMIVFVLGLALAHMVGEQRAQERTARLIFGILFLAAASGFVA